MFLREEVKDDLIKKCSIDDLPYDLAKLFITQEGISSSDLFKYKYSLVDDQKFFKDVFEYIFNYSVDKIKKRNFYLITKDILSKLECNNYYISFNKNINYIEPDFIISKYLEDLLKFTYKECDMNDFFAFITTIRTMAGIDPNVLKNIILNNKILWDYDLFKLLIQDNLLDFNFIYELFIKIYDFYPKYLLNDLILDIYQHKHIFLGFVSFLLDKYSYSINSKREYVFFIKYNITSKKEKNILKYLRREITKLIDTDLELDVLEHVNFSIANSMMESNPRYKEIWNSIRIFLTSKDRVKNRISNFSKYGTEDYYEMYNDDFITDLYIHIYTLAYINDLPFLDDWNMFIRMFNINRFYFAHARNQIRIQAKLGELVDIYTDIIKLATNTKLYLYLYEINEQK